MNADKFIKIILRKYGMAVACNIFKCSSEDIKKTIFYKLGYIPVEGKEEQSAEITALRSSVYKLEKILEINTNKWIKHELLRTTGHQLEIDPSR